MALITLFGSLNDSKAKRATAQRRINLYYEILQDADKTRIVAHSTAGTRQIESQILPVGQVLGIYFWTKYQSWAVVTTSFLYLLNAAGYPISNIGLNALSATRVSMADNGTQLCIALSAPGVAIQTAVYNGDTGVLQYQTDSGAATVALQSVTCIDGYFIGVDSAKAGLGQIRCSGVYNGTSWPASNVAAAEALPDALLAVWSTRSAVALLGDFSTEFWANNGATTGVPFQRIAGTTRDVGLAALNTVAALADRIFFLGKTQAGGLQVFSLSGQSIDKVSTSDVETNFATYNNPQNADACAYVIDGHEFYQINFDANSWLYDATSGLWSELVSPGFLKSTVRYATGGINTQSVVMAADFAANVLVWLETETPTELGDVVERTLITPHVFDGNDLDRVRVGRLRLDMQGGVAASVYLSISRDGGSVYGREMLQKTLKAPEYLRRCEWRRLGIARDWVLKIRVVSGERVALIGGYLLYGR